MIGDSQSRRPVPPVTGTSATINQGTSTESTPTQTNLISSQTSNAFLTRAFAILIRQITDLLIRWSSNDTHDENPVESVKVSERNSSTIDFLFFSPLEQYRRIIHE